MWVIRAWQCFSLEVTVQSFKKCCVSSAMDGTDDDSYRMALKRMGVFVVSVRKMQALTLKTETVSLIGKDRQNLTCFVIKCVKSIVKHFFLSGLLFFWGHLKFG
jgi:hypothetical protein